MAFSRRWSCRYVCRIHCNHCESISPLTETRIIVPYHVEWGQHHISGQNHWGLRIVKHRYGSQRLITATCKPLLGRCWLKHGTTHKHTWLPLSSHFVWWHMKEQNVFLAWSDIRIHITHTKKGNYYLWTPFLAIKIYCNLRWMGDGWKSVNTIFYLEFGFLFQYEIVHLRFKVCTFDDCSAAPFFFRRL